MEEEEKATLERMARITALETALVNLKGADVVLGMLYWNSGFALDGASATSKFLDDWLTRPRGDAYQRHLTRANPKAPPLWFQPAGDTRGQTWTGPFRDADNNGVMEFAAATEALRPERWSNELNFLARRAGNREVVDLPAGAKVRVSVQWWEPHDRALSELDYRNPVAQLKLQLVKQRDPSGAKFATDEIDLIAESEGLPTRLHLEPNFGVYEHSLELTIPADGRYALRIEGSVPNRTRPPGVPTLVSQEVGGTSARGCSSSRWTGWRYLLADFAVSKGRGGPGRCPERGRGRGRRLNSAGRCRTVRRGRADDATRGEAGRPGPGRSAKFGDYSRPREARRWRRPSRRARRRRSGRRASSRELPQSLRFRRAVCSPSPSWPVK